MRFQFSVIRTGGSHFSRLVRISHLQMWQRFESVAFGEGKSEEEKLAVTQDMLRVCGGGGGDGDDGGSI
jgi:hypothetical protein